MYKAEGIYRTVISDSTSDNGDSFPYSGYIVDMRAFSQGPEQTGAVYCPRCNSNSARVDNWRDAGTLSLRYRFSCHGEEYFLAIPEEQVFKTNFDLPSYITRVFQSRVSAQEKERMNDLVNKLNPPLLAMPKQSFEKTKKRENGGIIEANRKRRLIDLE